jgi:hypothetical protein
MRFTEDVTNKLFQLAGIDILKLLRVTRQIFAKILHRYVRRRNVK